MVTAYLTPSKWETCANVTISGLPIAGDTLVIDYPANAGVGDDLPMRAQIILISVNILEIKVGERIVRLSPLNPDETAAQREASKKLMVG